MRKITVVVPFSSDAHLNAWLQQFDRSALVERIMVIDERGVAPRVPVGDVWTGRGWTSGSLWNELIGKTETPYLLFIGEKTEIRMAPEMLDRFVEIAETTGAAIVYSDYCRDEKENRGGVNEAPPAGAGGSGLKNPVNDYQEGSVRDDFDFGPVILISAAAARKALKRRGPIAEVRYAGFYDLRLKLSIDNRFFHIREFLYEKIVRKTEGAHRRESQFDYVDPRNEAVQKEMERVFTDYLKTVGAYLAPAAKKMPGVRKKFPVEASVVIPVRNRQGTIAEAVKSALSQKTDFPFNVVVVDNHSTDGTTKILNGIATTDKRLSPIVPGRFDLNIGGCWNEAVYSRVCGRYAVQLDSDDLYSGPDALQKIVEMFRQGGYAMVIGAYTLVNEHLVVIPPGLVDHKEWTDENGRNNALRINGLGAPRAFDTAILRQTGFLNVSYGEDYAVGLKLSRAYAVGRIFDNLYLCRRWTGNTDAGLSMEVKNSHDAFKDSIRTLEIMARKKMNKTKR